MSTGNQDRVAVIDACRTPFLRSGTAYYDLMAWELGRCAVKGLVARTGIDPSIIDYAIIGTVMADVATTNVAREIMLGAGLPVSIPSHTCTAACVSANVAVTSACDMIKSGQADTVIAGGTESMSDPVIKISKRYRRFLLDLTLYRRPKSLAGKFKLLRGMKIKDFLTPEKPAIAEYSTGLTMGENADRLARRLGITRKEQDDYAARSHRLAAAAIKTGVMKKEVVPVVLPRTGQVVTEDNGPRGDATAEKLAAIKPAFDRRYGTVTAANASFLTDGASAVLLMKESKAKSLGLKPLAYIRSYSQGGSDPWEELLLGPAFATARVLKKETITLADIKVLEIHEAFAAQILANIRYMESEKWCRERLGLQGPMGTIDRDILNTRGGSLSIGHPFGATGGRLIASCCNRMQEENARFGLVGACGAGGIGNVIILENAQ
ncbi:MAG: acetyl-CoA C-acyltransferase [Deltaproteobacteria bacterium HGW-Deltaproteobacteria-12]|jgi:acetyl-CoA acyltransferase|nr:MAG: acetyl-CoA C-acyltransferase [Deltaproteobacteria bacterium HGW-Deltaproteobacteria-12]